MPRTGVSYDDVVESIHMLEKAGLTASIRNIRDRIGSGSLTTIAEHKRAYEVNAAATPREALPDPIAKGLLASAETFWAELVEAAESEISAIRSGAAAAAEESAETIQRLKSNLADAQEALSANSLVRDTLNARCAELTQEREAASAQSQALIRELYTVRVRLEASERAVSQGAADRGKLEALLAEAASSIKNVSEHAENAAVRHAETLAALNEELGRERATGAKRLAELEAARIDRAQALSIIERLESEAKTSRDQLARSTQTEADLQAAMQNLKESQAEARASSSAQIKSQTALLNEKDARIDAQSAEIQRLGKALSAKKKRKKAKQAS